MIQQHRESLDIRQQKALPLYLKSKLMINQVRNPISISAAPLYWSAYEYVYEKSKTAQKCLIPQDIWQANINWLADNLRAYGFRTVCIDGWGDDYAFNENGYRIKHSTDWEHSYQWWSNRLQSKGLSLGIYNNPLWVNMMAVKQNKMIKGTRIPLSKIVNQDEDAMFFTWVQVDNQGAQQYVKGYIQYYADMGVRYLRVDFLCWYQDGKDRDPDLCRPIKRDIKDYQKALKWMKQACDANQMVLSLVMPHLYDHAKDEIEYAGGSMARINADVLNGGWNRFNSVERNIKHDIWPTCENAFDGFIHWSDISGFGPNHLVLDGDFTRINKFSNLNQRQTAISLQMVAGAPLAIADQYNTIGSCIQFYQNAEILELNLKKFVGKPLSNDTKNVKSQIWKGRFGEREWIVALFNREDQVQSREFDILEELGTPVGYVRDLWQHKDLPPMSKIKQDIPSHGCKVYRIARHIYESDTPTFTPCGGTYSKEVSVTLSTRTEGASIYYTLDGTEPSSKSILYTGPILLEESTQIRAVTINWGVAASFKVRSIYSVTKQTAQKHKELYVAIKGWASSEPIFHQMFYQGNNRWKSRPHILTARKHEYKIVNCKHWSKDEWGELHGTSGQLSPTRHRKGKYAVIQISEPSRYIFYFHEITNSINVCKEIIN